MYLTIMIDLVAFSRSHMERGLTQHLESLPTPYLALMINTMAVSLRESRLHWTSDVPVEQLEGLRCGDVSDLDESELEDASKHTSEE